MQHQRTQIGMSLRNKAEHIMQLALIPGSRRQQRRQALIVQRPVRGELRLEHVDIVLIRIIEQAVNRQHTGAQRFVSAEHSCQRMAAAIAADIRRTTQIFRFN